MRGFLAAVVIACAWILASLGAFAEGAPRLAKCVLTLSPEVDCPSCEEGIKHVLQTARGVQSAQLDVLTNKVEIRYDPARIDVKALIGRIAVMGYTAREGK